MTNINPTTGVRYGTIYLNNLDSDLQDQLMFGSQSTNLSEQEALKELKIEIERDADNIEEEVLIAIAEREYVMLGNDNLREQEIEAAYECLGYNDRDDYVDTRLEFESEHIQIEEPTIEGEYEEVKYCISWLGGAPLLFVFESPFKGKFDLCSPCCPNAVSLESPNPNGYEGYDVPPDWRGQF